MNARITALVQKCGADGAVVLETSAVVQNRACLDMCRQNACGAYGNCWMCPPDAGDIETLMGLVRSYRYAVVFQIVRGLEDCFDIESMGKAGAELNVLARRIRREASAFLPELLVLGAGGCRVCKPCAKVQNRPCRNPEEALLSLEACGVDVYQTVKDTSLKYNNGPNTVTFFGMLLYN